MLSCVKILINSEEHKNRMARDLTPVHPELREVAKTFPRLTFNRWNLWLIRRLMVLQPKQKIPDDVQLDQTYVQSQDMKHNIRLRIYKPKVMTAPVLVWMHGGGLIIGKPEMDDGRLSQLVHKLGIVVVSVDYRLAPNHPFPSPLDDCYTALKWVNTHAETLGIDPNRIAVGGESAGGGLAASLAQLALDRGEVKLVFQLLIYPMLDDTSSLRTDVPNTDLLIWNQKSNRFGWESYLQHACGSDTAAPYAVASRRADLTGLPPAWIGVGTLDLFYEEDMAYAQKLKESGVECELVITPGGFHGFDTLDHGLQVVQEFRKSQMAALRRHLLST
jgi:acetyl esterase/lipase